MNNRKTELYRHFNAKNELLYIGVSKSTLQRFGQHLLQSPWHADVTRIDIEYFENRQLALDAEKDAIKKEKPIFNINHSNYQIPFNISVENYKKIIEREDSSLFYFRADSFDDVKKAMEIHKKYKKFIKKLNATKKSP